jgi:alpha-amylase
LYGTSYKDNGRDGNEYEIFLDRVDELEGLIRARKNYAFGYQRDYFDHGNCIGWTREGDGVNDGCAVILSNGNEGNKIMEVGKHYSGMEFIDHLGKIGSNVLINEEGWGEFSCNAGSVSVWVKKL